MNREKFDLFRIEYLRAEEFVSDDNRIGDSYRHFSDFGGCGPGHVPKEPMGSCTNA